jgi:hypothetical protein
MPAATITAMAGEQALGAELVLRSGRRTWRSPPELPVLDDIKPAPLPHPARY